MKLKAKKMLSVLLAAAMISTLFVALPITASAVDDEISRFWKKSDSSGLDVGEGYIYFDSGNTGGGGVSARRQGIAGRSPQ